MLTCLLDNLSLVWKKSLSAVLAKYLNAPAKNQDAVREKENRGDNAGSGEEAHNTAHALYVGNLKNSKLDHDSSKCR